jgi:hypothetical protein
MGARRPRLAAALFDRDRVRAHRRQRSSAVLITLLVTIGLMKLP